MKAKIIPIFSNKGGVGKTFFAVNLSTALALSGKKTLLLDLDLQAGQDMAQMLNTEPQQSIVQILPELLQEETPNFETIQKVLFSHSSGLDYASAVIDAPEIAQLSSKGIITFFNTARPHYDFIIIDLGQSFSEVMISVLDHANMILLIATPDVLAVYQLTWCIKILQDLHIPSKMVRLVLNRAKSQGSVAWQEVRNALDLEIFGLIPSDGKGVGKAIQGGNPYVVENPRGAVSDAFKKMLNELKKKNIYVQTTNIQRTKEDKNKFKESEGVLDKLSKNITISQESNRSKPHSDLGVMKQKIQLQLVERLELTTISSEQYSDPVKLQALKETAKKIVSQLLVEEKGAFISSHEDRLRTVNEIINETFGLGVLDEVMADPGVTDVMVNGSQEIYVEKDGDIMLTKHKFVSDQQLRSIIDRIVAPLGRRIDESMPLVDARLPDGSRFNAIIPPLCLNGPCMTIRKFNEEKLSVDDIVYRFKSLSEPIRDFLYACVIGRMNIIISGGTGSGKTTLLNVLSQYVPDTERIITVEDAAELQLQKDHWCRLESRPSNVEGVGEINLRDLFINSLRMRPDRIIIGECRGPEVLDMLQAMNTGHDGSMTTLHANSTRDVLIRMSSMILLSGVELPMRAINEMLSSAINVIIQMSRFTDGSRKITGITEIIGMTDEHELELRDIFIFRQTGRDPSGTVQGFYETCDYEPKCGEELITKGIKLDRSIFHTDPVQAY
ncbi:MAG: Flp pilus assembly complex ATPase component TadA [Candidatus Omnitrophica bacterium]|nr:Flp pilus assembly complex ATPase component TadA [Candidatus Omnitrophota bacterium]